MGHEESMIRRISMEATACQGLSPRQEQLDWKVPVNSMAGPSRSPCGMGHREIKTLSLILKSGSGQPASSSFFY